MFWQVEVSSVPNLSNPQIVFQLAKLFADLSTMADMTLPTTPQVSIHGGTSSSTENKNQGIDETIISHQGHYVHWAGCN